MGGSFGFQIRCEDVSVERSRVSLVSRFLTILQLSLKRPIQHGRSQPTQFFFHLGLQFPQRIDLRLSKILNRVLAL